MKGSLLKEIEAQALNNANYQFKGKNKNDETMRALAVKAFNRLSKQEQDEVRNKWEAFRKTSDVKFTDTDCIWYRFLAQSNLFFLCKLLEKYSLVSDHEYEYDDKFNPQTKIFNTHEYICNEFFVKKDPANFGTFKEFADSYDPHRKERLLLVPRGGFKSSMDIADCVQWIICWPEVTILILTGTLPLAEGFVSELRGHFSFEQTGQTGVDKKPIFGPRTMPDGSKSIFQILFPEHCIKANEGSRLEYIDPAARVRDKEPTVMSGSIESNLTGWHFTHMKLDDVVTGENSQTLTRMDAINRQISINQAMLHPYGFYDKIGTWYDEADTYGLDINSEEKLKESDGPDAQSIIIHLRPCWWPTKEAIKAGKIESTMTKDDMTLWGPTILTYEKLVDLRRKDPTGFAIKYLNDPRKVHDVKFPRELLMRRTIPANMLPPQGMIVQTWDAAYSVKSWADYTVGITALIYGGRFYIIDMTRGRYNEYDLPAVMAAAANKWKPKRISIEDSVGVKWMSRELRREMDKLRISVPVEYVSLGYGTAAKSKDMKAKPVLRLLGDERLFFSNSCQGLTDLYIELEKFGTVKDGKDDIVSALSLLVEQYASYADSIMRMAGAAEMNFHADRKMQAMHDMVHGITPPSSEQLAYSYTQWKAGIVEDDNPVIPNNPTNTIENSSEINPLDILGIE